MKYRIPSLLLAALMAASAVSCGSAGTTTDTTEAPSGDTTTAEQVPTYEWPTAYSGSEFKILNYEDIYNMHSKLSPEESTGETLNDAQFNAVSYFEEMTGVTLVETNIHMKEDFPEQFPQLVLSGDDASTSLT